MADAMVTARMPQSKKDAGNEVLRKHGYTASQAINELYDRVVETQSWPLARAEMGAIDSQRLAEALSFVDGIARVSADDFVDFDFHEAKRKRLTSKGRAVEADFE